MNFIIVIKFEWCNFESFCVSREWNISDFRMKEALFRSGERPLLKEFRLCALFSEMFGMFKISLFQVPSIPYNHGPENLP